VTGIMKKGKKRKRDVTEFNSPTTDDEIPVECPSQTATPEQPKSSELTMEQVDSVTGRIDKGNSEETRGSQEKVDKAAQGAGDEDVPSGRPTPKVQRASIGERFFIDNLDRFKCSLCRGFEVTGYCADVDYCMMTTVD